MKDRKRKKTKIRLSKKEQDRKKKKPTIDTDYDLNVTNAYKINKLVKNQQLLNLTCMHACKSVILRRQKGRNFHGKQK
jgi:hypothetical protein